MGVSDPRADCGLRQGMMPRSGLVIGPTGRYSPLRYPGGKGKLAKFMAAIVRANRLSDGRYVEPFAGGAGIAWELLITGVVRRVLINDISPQVFAFWASVLRHTDELCRLIRDVPLSVEEWDRQKDVFRAPEDASTLELGFSCFYLNRTNRSGILNGGLIGGRNQPTFNIPRPFRGAANPPIGPCIAVFLALDSRNCVPCSHFSADDPLVCSWLGRSPYS